MRQHGVLGTQKDLVIVIYIYILYYYYYYVYYLDKYIAYFLALRHLLYPFIEDIKRRFSGVWSEPIPF